jgi:hypothetical protein
MRFLLPIESKVSPEERVCEVRGPISNLKQFFFGKDVVFVGSRVFLYSRASYLQFISVFFGLSLTFMSGFFSELLLVGLGFRLIKINGFLFLKLGHSHYIKVSVPEGLFVLGYKKRLVIFGVRSSDVNQFVERIVSFRSPDVYKNKGVQVIGRSFRLKVGKQK